MLNRSPKEPGPASCQNAAVIVAHPDDETLWCGGYLLTHPAIHWRIVTLCRASDQDRAPKFHRVLDRFGAEGDMADLDDGPEQEPLPVLHVQETASRLLAGRHYDLVLTHGPLGEYTRHRRHEECCRAVVELWQSGRLDADQLWLFSYEDGGRTYLPRIRQNADRRERLTHEVWTAKHHIITCLYGFAPESWEALATPRKEGFSCFDSPQAAVKHVASFEELP